MKHKHIVDAVNEPTRVQIGASGYAAAFPARGRNVAQIVTFPRWSRLTGNSNREVVDAFLALHGDSAQNTRSVAATNLNKLCHYIERKGYTSLLQLTQDDADTLLLEVGRVASTRANVWSAIYRVVVQAYSSANRRAPQMDPHPWSARPRDFEVNHLCTPNDRPQAGSDIRASGRANSRSGKRLLLAMQPTQPIETHLLAGTTVPHLVASNGSFGVHIPARGRHDSNDYDFSDWHDYNPHLAHEITEYLLTVKTTSAHTSITTWRSECKTFLSFLKTDLGIKTAVSFSQISASQLNRYRAFIDRGNIQRRVKLWLTATKLVTHFCKSKRLSVPAHVKNPWPGHAVRAPVATQPMTTSVSSRLLAACQNEVVKLDESCQDPNYRGPTLRELYAPLVLMTFWTLFNPETVVAIRYSDIGVASAGRIGVSGVKGRSSKEQYATFAAVDAHPCSPSSLISLLGRLTEPVRSQADPALRDYLFLGRVIAPKAGKRIQTFAKLTSSTMLYYRDAFCEENGIDHFTLQQIRETGAVTAMRLFGGDQKVVQELLNHESSDTTSSYIQRDARRLENIAIADQMEKRTRYVRSHGKRDIRDTPGATESAATPGFVCADPFHPPASLDQPDGMCAAYGACPTCPLASVDSKCETSLAQVLRLRNQISAARNNPRMEPARWAFVWNPRLQALENTWLAAFDARTALSAAAAIWDINVPDIVDM